MGTLSSSGFSFTKGNTFHDFVFASPDDDALPKGNLMFLWDSICSLKIIYVLFQCRYNRASVSRKLIARLPRQFRTRSWVPKKRNPIAADIIPSTIISAVMGVWVIFFYILITVCYVYPLELPRWGNSNESTQHTFMLKKLKKMFLLRLLTWRYDEHSLARNTPVSNIFS